jgi:hypothetical protein
MDEEMKWYITAMALGAGEDYQTFAPLPGGNLGTSTQSEVLHRKSRGKGPAFFMRTIESIFKFRGIIPQNATFTFKEKDLAEEKEKADLAKTVAENLAILTRAGILTTDASRQILVQSGLLDETIMKSIPKDFIGTFPMAPDTNIGSDLNDTMSQDVGNVEKALETKFGEVTRIVKGQMKYNEEKKLTHETLDAVKDAVLQVSEIEPPVINVTIPEQPAPIINVSVPEQKQSAPVVNVTPEIKVEQPDVKVYVPKEESDEIVEVLERDREGRMKKLRKRKRK